MDVETYQTSRSILCGLDLDVLEGFGAKYQAQLKLKIWVWGRELEEKERGSCSVLCGVSRVYYGWSSKVPCLWL